MTDKILIDRPVAQQVGLQVLEALDEIAWSNDTKWQSDRADSVRLVLRATLEQQVEQKPVAWIRKEDLERLPRTPETVDDGYTAPGQQLRKIILSAKPHSYYGQVPLYKHQQAHKRPLTEDQIFNAIRSFYSSDVTCKAAIRLSIDEYRAIEQAHGIN